MMRGRVDDSSGISPILLKRDCSMNEYTLVGVFKRPKTTEKANKATLGIQRFSMQWDLMQRPSDGKAEDG